MEGEGVARIHREIPCRRFGVVGAACGASAVGRPAHKPRSGSAVHPRRPGPRRLRSAPVIPDYFTDGTCKLYYKLFLDPPEQVFG